jgi:hypothetical protein
MIILRIVIVDETSLQIHHLGDKPFPVFQRGADVRLDIGQGDAAGVGKHGLTMLLPVAGIAIQILEQNIFSFFSHNGIPPFWVVAPKRPPWTAFSSYCWDHLGHLFLLKSLSVSRVLECQVLSSHDQVQKAAS